MLRSAMVKGLPPPPPVQPSAQFAGGVAGGTDGRSDMTRGHREIAITAVLRDSCQSCLTLEQLGESMSWAKLSPVYTCWYSDRQTSHDGLRVQLYTPLEHELDVEVSSSPGSPVM